MSKVILLSAASLSMFAALNAKEAGAQEKMIADVRGEVAVANGEIAARCIPKKKTPLCKPKPKPICKLECICEEEARGHIYFSGRGGANFLHAGEKDEIELHPKVGYAVGGALGYRWRFNLDLEAEFTYRYNGVNTVEFLGNDVIACGSVNSFSYMANAVYHIPYSFSKCSITSYVGAGIGYIHQHAKACPYELPGEGERGGFGWQVMAGFKQSLYTFLELSAEYRFNKGPLNYLYNQTAYFAFTFLF
jgi:opacity protein-like surface antigen